MLSTSSGCKFCCWLPVSSPVPTCGSGCRSKAQPHQWTGQILPRCRNKVNIAASRYIWSRRGVLTSWGKRSEPSTRLSTRCSVVGVWQSSVYPWEGLRGFWSRAFPGVLPLFFLQWQRTIFTSFCPLPFFLSPSYVDTMAFFFLAILYLCSLAAGSSKVSKVTANT